MDEPEQIHRLREMRTKSIEHWGQVFLSLAAGIASLFVLQANTSKGWDFGTLIIGWALLACCLLLWRYIVLHIDREIVHLYPEMIRIDRENNWQTQTSYFYRNLSKLAKRHIASKMKLTIDEIPVSYHEFTALTTRKKRNQYDLLLDAWNEFGPASVSSRGHAQQDFAVFATIAILFCLILFSKYQSPYVWMALFGFLVFFLLWANYAGWIQNKSDLPNTNGENEPLDVRDRELRFNFGISYFLVAIVLMRMMGPEINSTIIPKYAYFIVSMIALAIAILMVITSLFRHPLIFFRRASDIFYGLPYIPYLAFFLGFLDGLIALANSHIAEWYVYVSFGIGILFAIIFLLSTYFFRRTEK